ncbi:hypothetical protein PENTCL1PPCAC_27159 [Pristionchus entomophagus]|uniref:Fork-head domain-containing protein n=1 Tax=Pristionchus entomophagus TaxID=358040 RepID=A0AAV5UDE5_9BILA|nr:hypothetical protein PENTCL1PPCAC_27159 [Pristionchus entomophagus]
MDFASSLLALPQSSLERLQASIAAAAAAAAANGGEGGGGFLSSCSSSAPTTPDAQHQSPPQLTLSSVLAAAAAAHSAPPSPTVAAGSPSPPAALTALLQTTPHSPSSPLLTAPTSTTPSISSTSPSVLASSEGTSTSPSKLDAGSGMERPSLSYKDLIIEAIESSPDKRLKLNEIYQVIRMLHPYYRLRPDQWGWQNSIRHNLSLHDCFVKLPLKQTNASGVVGHYWTVVPELSDKQTLRRRNRASNGGRAARKTSAAASLGAGMGHVGMLLSRSEESPIGSPHSSASASPNNEMGLLKPTATYGSVMGNGGVTGVGSNGLVGGALSSLLLNNLGSGMGGNSDSSLMGGISQDTLGSYAQQLLTTLMYQQAISGLVQLSSPQSHTADSSTAALLEPLLALSKLAAAQQQQQPAAPTAPSFLL